MKKSMCLRALLWAVTTLLLLLLTRLRGEVSPMTGMLLLLLVPPFSWLSAFLSRRNMTISLTLPGTGRKGAEIRGELRFRNGSFFVPGCVWCRIRIVNVMTGESDRLDIPVSVPARGQGTAFFSLNSGFCGYLRAETERVVLTDWLGFLPVHCRQKAEAKTAVLPETFTPELIVDSAAAPDAEEESYAPDKSGFDMSEIYQLREYVPGDPTKQIHWKLSEKLDTLIFREASLPVSRSMLLYWEKNSACTPAEADAMAEVTASLAQKLSEEGYSFFLGWNEGEIRHRESAENSEQLFSVLPELLKCRPKAGEEADCDGIFGEGGWGKVIFVGKKLPAGAEQYGAALSAVLCAAGETEPGRVYFSPGNYRQKLQGIVI